jgi:hypothetical protein
MATILVDKDQATTPQSTRDESKSTLTTEVNFGLGLITGSLVIETSSWKRDIFGAVSTQGIRSYGNARLIRGRNRSGLRRRPWRING